MTALMLTMNLIIAKVDPIANVTRLCVYVYACRSTMITRKKYYFALKNHPMIMYIMFSTIDILYSLAYVYVPICM